MCGLIEVFSNAVERPVRPRVVGVWCLVCGVLYVCVCVCDSEVWCAMCDMLCAVCVVLCAICVVLCAVCGVPCVVCCSARCVACAVCGMIVTLEGGGN